MSTCTEIMACLVLGRKDGRKERKKEEKKTLFYTNNILIITLMQYVKFNQIFGLGKGMSRNLRKQFFFLRRAGGEGVETQ